MIPEVIDLPPDAALIADTPRLRLVPLVVEDAPELFDALDDDRLQEFSGGRPLDEAGLTDLVRRLQERRSPDGEEVWCTWVVRLVPLGEALGIVEATVTDDGRAVIGCVIGAEYNRHAFAHEALTAMARLLQAHLAVTVLEAFIPPEREAARRVAARLGLERTGLSEDGRELWRGTCEDPVLTGGRGPRQAGGSWPAGG